MALGHGRNDVDGSRMRTERGKRSLANAFGHVVGASKQKTITAAEQMPRM
jgi:hypothetical protein